jgi:hypothetical protein
MATEQSVEHQTNPASPRPRKANALTVIAIVLSGFQVLQLFYIIHRYAVDVPYWDQWDFYNAFFQPHGLWEIFSWEHGPHRQGAGFFLIWLTNGLTGWDQRAQAFMIGIVMVCAAAAALWLKKRLIGPLQWHDAIPVLMILSLKPWEIYFNTPNVSHGALPLLLILLLGISWTVKNPFLRYSLVVVLNFLALFTGFGVFAALVTPILLAFDCRHTVRNRKWRELVVAGAALCCSIASIGCFFHNYIFQSAVDCFHFPDPHWYLYPVFMAIEFAAMILQNNTASIRTSIVGLFALGIVLYMLGAAFLRLRQQAEHYSRHQAVFFLLAYSLLFAANAAVGRLCLGLEAASISRYVPLIMPSMVGAYLYYLGHPQRVRRKQVIAVLFCATVYTCIIPWQLKAAERLCREKASWVQAYRVTGDAKSADALSGCRVYPDPDRTNLDHKLNWLRLHHFSLFRK